MDQVVAATEPGTLVAGTADFTPSDANTPRLVPPILMAKLKGDRTQTSDCSLDSVDTVAAGSRSNKDVETSGVPIVPPANYGDRRDTVTTLVDLPEEDVAEELVVADVAQQIEDESPPVNKAQVAIATEEEATVLKAETAAEVIALKDKRQVVEVITATPSKLDWNQLLPEETARGFFQRTRAELSKEQLRELLGKVYVSSECKRCFTWKSSEISPIHSGPFWHDFRHVYMESFNFRRLPLDYAIR